MSLAWRIAILAACFPSPSNGQQVDIQNLVKSGNMEGLRQANLVHAQDARAGQAPQKSDSSEAYPQVKKAKKEKRGSIVVAPIPISSPAIGSGVLLAGGYIFPFRKSDKVSQPSTIGAAGLITDNGSRGWGLGGEFYFK